MCSVCKPKLPSCPTCRSRFTEARNLAMEKVSMGWNNYLYSWLNPLGLLSLDVLFFIMSVIEIYNPLCIIKLLLTE